MHFELAVRRTWVALALVICASLIAVDAAQAQQGKAIARCTTVEGSLLAQSKAGGWEAVAPQTAIPADRLLVALFGADFQSSNGAIEGRFVADVGQRGPFPVLEAAARFHSSKSADLDITLERGISAFRNAKKAGAAQLRLRVHDEVFTVTLSEPNARLGVEIYGRHVPGPAHVEDPKQDVPVVNVVFFALAGEIVIGSDKQVTRLHAPPGLALYMWDTVTRTAETRRYEMLPDFVKPMTDEERAKFTAICAISKSLTRDPAAVSKSLLATLRAPGVMERKTAVVALGALDELPGLWGALNDDAHADVRDMAILVLRHWLGRESGQSVRLYHHLTKNAGYTPTQAKNVLHLLLGIQEERRRQAGTYDLLVEGLNHGKLPMRELARWHLVRLVPEGKSIVYDAGAAEPQRQQAIAAWRRLIPEGELPAPPKKKEGAR